jgi:hypothetical protein
MLPKDIGRGFSLHWRPIFEVMEACPGLDPADEDSFERGIPFLLKSRVKYAFKIIPKWSCYTSVHACKRFIHGLCSMANDLGGEDDCF